MRTFIAAIYSGACQAIGVPKLDVTQEKRLENFLLSGGFDRLSGLCGRAIPNSDRMAGFRCIVEDAARELM